MAKRGIALCADDFGLSAGIDAAVVDLIGAGRLTATSVMVAGPDAVRSAPTLLSLDAVRRGQAEIGLHLTFTDLDPLGDVPGLIRDGQRMSVADLIAASVARDPSYDAIKAETDRQIDRFVAIFGRAPDYVDGHQHVHLLPKMRKAIFAAVDEGRLEAGRTWIRSCHEPAHLIVRRGVSPAKAAFISLIGAGIPRAARQHGVGFNDSFRGVSDFDPSEPVSDRFRSFLWGPGQRPLIMCHPSQGIGDTPFPDPIGEARLAEYAYLAGDQFQADLDEAGFRLLPMSRL